MGSHDSSKNEEQAGITPTQVQEVVSRTALLRIDLIRYSGKVNVDSAGETVLRLELDAKTPQFLVLKDRIRCRFSHRFVATTEDGQKVATLRADHVATFELEEGPQLPEAAIATWTETNVFFMVYPYLREAVHSMSVRMGLDPIILGVLRRDELRPAGRTELVRSNGDQSSD